MNKLLINKLLMNKLLSEIEKFKPSCQQEETDKRIIIDLIEKNRENILERKNEIFHITVSGFTMNKSRTKLLMVFHNIYNSWSWIGGHADGEADLLSVAMREVKEETGVTQVNPFSKDIISMDILTTKGHIKNGNYVAPHLHLNITYFLEANEENPLRIKEDENSGVTWISVNEMEEYVTEEEMKMVYKKIISKGVIL